MSGRRAARRRALAAAAAALALGAAACGGDDEPAAETSTGAAETAGTATTAAAPTERTGAAPPAASARRKGETAPSTEGDTGGTFVPGPEHERGGAGDEEPAVTLAQLTGRGGRITPPLVRVPAYIAVRVELRSADGRPYALRIGGRALRAGGELSSASARFPGLRPDAALLGVPIGGAGTPVRVEASAEPGP